MLQLPEPRLQRCLTELDHPLIIPILADHLDAHIPGLDRLGLRAQRGGHAHRGQAGQAGRHGEDIVHVRVEGGGVLEAAKPWRRRRRRWADYVVYAASGGRGPGVEGVAEAEDGVEVALDEAANLL